MFNIFVKFPEISKEESIAFIQYDLTFKKITKKKKNFFFIIKYSAKT